MREESFVKIPLKEESRVIDPIDGKIANVSPSEMTLSCLFYRLIPTCIIERCDEDRYTSRSSETTSSSERFLNMKLEILFLFIATSKGWGGVV